MTTPRSLFLFPILISMFLNGRPALAEGASIANASQQQKKEATESYTNGMAKFQKKNFGPAMADFEQSYGAVKSPNTLLMVARSLIELGQLSEGYRRLLQTEQEAALAKKTAPKYEATEIAAREERVELGKKLGFLTISVPSAKPGDKVLLEGRELLAADWKEPVPVMPGSVEVTLASGSDRFTQHVEVKAGGTAALSLEAPAPEEPKAVAAAPVVQVEVQASPSSSKLPLYISGGVGIAGLATFAIFGASSRSKYSDLDSACPSKMNCPASLESKRDDGTRAQAIANVGLMVGIFGASSAAFFYLTGTEEKPEEVHTARVPRVDVGLGSVSVSGSF
ncbi:MAG: hypothetical protein SFV15_15625 [Polyangiaceae bacterium]|nr:hypothetical protein [Polyangiaceae bacterium]